MDRYSKKNKLVTKAIVIGTNTIPYGIVRSLIPYGVSVALVVNNSNSFALRSRYPFLKKVIPPYTTSPDLFYNTFLKWAQENNLFGSVIMVGCEEYLFMLSKMRDRLDKNFICAFSDYESVKIAAYKNYTFIAAKKSNIPMPRSLETSEIQDFKEQLKNYKFPILLKPVESLSFIREFRQKVILCNTIEEVIKNCSKYTQTGHELLIQEYIPGPLSSLVVLKTVLSEKAEPLAVSVDRKIALFHENGAAVISESCWSDKVAELGLKLLKEINYFGYASVEFKIDPRDNIPKLMEINGRFSYNHTQALASGVNLPLKLYEYCINKQDYRIVSGITNTYIKGKIWWRVSTSPSFVLKTLLSKESQKSSVLRKLFQGKVHMEPLNFYDPAPFIYEILMHIKRTIKNGIWRFYHHNKSGKKNQVRWVP